MNNKFKRGAAAAMAAVMLCGAIPARAFTYDIAGHQAEQIMKQWIEEGYMAGDGNGYHPDQEITRAEFMTFANKVLKLTEEATISQFKDVQESAWYYHEVAKAHKAGYTSGTSATTMSPNAKITNQEMYLMLAAMTTGLPDGDLSHVADRAELAPWAEKGVREGISEGYIVGKDGKIAPNHKVTRSEAIVFLDGYKTDSRTFAYPGAYSVGTVAKVTVQSNGVTLKSAKIQGDLVLGKDVDSVVLDKVTVGGQIIKENPNTKIMEPGQWMDGKYEGQAKGDHGQVHVTVTFKDGRITDVKLGKHMEGEQGEKVMQPVLDQIIETGDVKKIKLGNQSGINAKAALNAVRDAAAQANGQTVQAGESSFAKEFTVLRDGTYMGISNGYGGKIKVELVVKNHKIDSLTLLHHTETPEYMVITEKILGVIARNGGVEGVDTITGATVTADALIYASEDALSQSYGMTTAPGQSEHAKLKPAEHNPDMPQGGDFENLVDGVYHGQADGYGGAIKVTVTVKGGKVTEVKVDEHNETLSYYNKTLPLLDRIVEHNSTDVDTITGATDTSHGILAAVENALSDFIEVVPYADGVWYGQGRGYYPNDKYGNGKLLRTSSDVAVTVKDGHVTDVEVMYHGDDETYGGYLQEDFDTFKQYIIDHNGTEGLINIMNKQEHGNPVYDAVSGATMSARGYVAAIEDALNRAHKFARDGQEQTIRSLTLLNNPGFTVPPTQFYYGEDVDLSGLKVLIKYRDGREETVPFDQLQAKGVDCSLNRVFTPQPANGDYSEETNYDLVFVDPISTAEHRSQLQAKRMKVYREIAEIEVKTGAGETIVVEPNEKDFAYNAKVNMNEINGIQSVKITDTEGREVELDGYTMSSESGKPVMRIELSALPKPEDSDPYKLAYRYDSYKLKLDVDAPFNKDRITEFHLTSDPKHIYQEGEALDLTNVAVQAIDTNYKSEIIKFADLADYGFTVAQEDGTPVENGMLLDKVEKFNIVISHPDAASVKIAIEVNTKEAVLDKFEIRDVETNALLAVVEDPQGEQKYGELYVTLSKEYYADREKKIKVVGVDTNGKVMDLEPEWFMGSIMVMANDFSYVILFEEGEPENPKQEPTNILNRFEIRTVADDQLVAAVNDPAGTQKYGELYVTIPKEYYADRENLLKVVALDTVGCEMKLGDPMWYSGTFMATVGDISYMIIFEEGEGETPDPVPTNVLDRFEIRTTADDQLVTTIEDPAGTQEYGELYVTIPSKYFADRENLLKVVGVDTAGFEMKLGDPMWYSGTFMATVGDISYMIIFQEAAEIDPGTIPDGVYPGTGVGYGGQIKVEVTVKDNAITKVVVKEHSEGEEYLFAASTILDDVVTHNGTKGVDTITGATDTSHGILNAVNNALAQYKPQEETAYASGTWYGQGRGQNPYDRMEQSMDDYYRPVLLVKTATEVEVKVENGKIVDIVTLNHGDDGGPGNAYNPTKGYDRVKQYIIDHNGTDGLMEIFAEKQKLNNCYDEDGNLVVEKPYEMQLTEEGKSVVDAVTSATNSARGYVHAIDDALNRSQKFTLDGVEQKVRSIMLDAKYQQDNSIEYGKPLNLSDRMIKVVYVDGTSEEIPFGELEAHGITCNLPSGFIPEPEDKNFYNKNRNYILTFTDEASTAKHSSMLQARRAKEKVYCSKIELEINGQTQTIMLEDENSSYTVDMQGKAVTGVTNVKVYDKQGRPVPLKSLDLEGMTSTAPYFQINLADLVNKDSDPTIKVHKHRSFNLDFTNTQKVESFTVDTSGMKTEYAAGEKLDYTGMKVTLKFADGSENTVEFQNLDIYGDMDYDMYQGDELKVKGEQELRLYFGICPTQSITINVK